ncbi:hypothetical protein NQ315_014117 [Exocentrus adspersus]|uniref:EGF domain-specific O-linked N-acetylglucosamine transferase n=1 Tax=Exocentrus adspersus TaxID=1586481 RepID=A0AAV8VWI7_9CUCU|nr:hypothetical protein NQ315_014117 [Exocentrus adspersus]
MWKLIETYIIFLVFQSFLQVVCYINYSTINLPEEHLPYYFTSFPKIAEECLADSNCQFKNHLNKSKCWGYEYDCKWDRQYSIPPCPGDHKGWVKTKSAQQDTFYTQADFGYVKQQLREMRLYCDPLFSDDSSLELLQRQEPIRYKMDVLQEGDIGGYCDFRKDRLLEQADHISALQSWGPEMRVLNEDELVDSLNDNEEYDVTKVAYDANVPFKKQLEISRNSDVFIGIHGAGLTHLLFLPEWAALFELYNCEDANCYLDLARLRGVKYVTWEDEDKLTSIKDESYSGGAHAKFANYIFDVEEFKRLVTKAAKHVKKPSKI